MYDIGGNIRRLRKLNMLNQNEFSRKIGISQGSLSDIESGKCKSSIDTVVSIYQTFNCSLELLLTGREQKGAKDLPELESQLLHIFRELDRKDQLEMLEIASLKLRIH
ncbi:helix-turn-helix domain-containing protein [Paenibacillus sp. OV219]|uniref:helix-turn-helix domain-containing protein n=1 Tax=Paenibacillus sp. OV219 TaxID=1884377 RepID=UPI0008D74F23|nr:DNA-binding transcriptional regulator, XRE-family HTH domain [Paenibacillus sp. OV219]